MNREPFVGLAMAALLALFLWLLASPKPENVPPPPPSEPVSEADFVAPNGTPTIDGEAGDEVWQQSEWLPLDQVWIGAPPAPADFSGRYKLAWDDNNLYLLAQITDDTLVDTHPDGLDRYWDDDCLEIFLDEDTSGGNHQYNYNAFAYHIALDGRVADVAPDSSFQFYNDHCLTRRSVNGLVSTWEVAVKIFDGKRYIDGDENIPKSLSAGKRMGFALAYCDNDHSPERENFIGNVVVEGTDKNRGWIDAGIFGILELQ